MSNPLQTEQHLDADQLSAFLEGALPEPERLATLRHMAECAPCRELAFLAQAPEPLTDPTFVEAPAMPRPRRWAWSLFAPSRLLWTAALACCILGVFLFQLHTRSRSHSTPSVASVRPAVPPSSRAEPPAIPQPNSPSTPAHSGPAARTRLRATEPDPTPAAALLPNEAVAGKPPQSQVVTLGAAAAPALKSFAKAKAAAPNTPPELHGEARGTINGRNLTLLQPGSTAAGSVAANAAVAPPPAIVNAQGGQAIPPPAAPPAAASETVEVDSDQVSVSAAELAAVVPRKEHPLPSRLATTASVALGKHRLALDTGGTLFYSHNEGKHWKLIKPTWPGSVQSLNLTAGSHFQITTTTGALWTSADGHHWSPAHP